MSDEVLDDVMIKGSCKGKSRCYCKLPVQYRECTGQMRAGRKMYVLFLL